MNFPVGKKVWEKIKTDFAESDQAPVAEILNLYRDKERERVRTYILRLAQGDINEVRRLTEAANRDYRDIIYWAECPEEASLDAPEKRERMRSLFQSLGLETPEYLKEK